MTHLAYCGFNCAQCPVYQAAQSGDPNEKSRIAAVCSNGSRAFTAEEMTCLGCLDISSGNSTICAACSIRACARQKDLPTCAHCIQYPCPIIERDLPRGGSGRLRLDSFRPE